MVGRWIFPFKLVPFQWTWAEIRRSPVEVGSLSHYLQGFIHPRWLFAISAINSIMYQCINLWIVSMYWFINASGWKLPVFYLLPGHHFFFSESSWVFQDGECLATGRSWPCRLVGRGEKWLRRLFFSPMGCNIYLLGQWLNFKLFRITYLVGEIKLKLLFQGSIR